MSRISVLLDTDIGSNIDDALALAYLLSQPRCELLGVTTVSGQPQVRAQLADAVCQALGRPEVPIYSGAAVPLAGTQLQAEVAHAAVLEGYAHRSHFAPNVAVDFLRQTIRSRPGEIVLVCIGPLTNIGLLFALDPQIPTLLKGCVVMGGLYFSRPAGYGLRERNMMNDPAAAAIVFGAQLPEITCHGLDVTTQCRLATDTCRERLTGPHTRIIADMVEVWSATREEILFHDPLAAMCVFEPELCTYRSGRVSIELTSDALAGLTHFDAAGPQPPHQVAVGVQAQAAIEHFFSVVGRA